MKKEEFLEILGIQDEPLSTDRVRRGIKRAFLTGLFDDIKIEREDEVIRIKVRERQIIERIEVKGNFYLSGDDILGAFILKEGEPMRYDLLEDARKNLLAYLLKKGYPEVDIRFEIKEKRSRIRLKLHIKEGQPLIIKKIEGPEEITPFIRLSVDRPFDLTLLEGDINFIREYYKNEGFINPDVRASFEDGILHFSVNPGTRVIVKFQGNRAFSDRELFKLMPFSTAESISDELIEEARTRILLAYKKEGYPFAAVEVEHKAEIGQLYIVFKIDEGKRYRIGKIILSGITLPQDKLLKITGLKDKEYFIPEKLDLALERLRAFYRSLGYRNIVIDEPVLDFDEKTETLSILIMIQEGEQVLIDKIFIKGNREIDTEALREIMELREAIPFNETDINDAKLRLLEYYFSKGYIDAECDVEIVFRNSYADIVFNISEGRRYSFGRTIIRGNLDTSSRVIKRELPYETGAYFSHGSLLETRQRLYRLGLFSEVEIEPVREDSTQNVLITVKESPQGAFEFGIGYGEYERYRGFMDLSYRNISGMNRQISLRIETSSLERRFIINYYDPRLLDSRTSLRIIPLYEERKEKNIDTGEILYRLRRYAEKTGIETPLSENLKFELYHEFSVVKTYDVRPEIVLPREDAGTLAISSLVPGLVYDTRDNPFDPRKGILTGGRLKIASEALGSEVEFIKVNGDASTYISLSGKFVLALGLRAGIAWPFGKTEEIPVVERFFLGGRASVRGFSQDSLGPKINDTPVGGDSFIQTNLELRWYPGRSFSIVTFLDGGNVWFKDKGISLSDLRYSAGIGFRYNTPAGPVRLDYGQKLERRPGESKGEIHFSIGHAF
ncbi:MAG: outer membrane protein assembly factor BamA [Thermodesulfovibrionales bacterium]|nr:outer membrane protein assembly factor BamA [Thermodesulfovibrionales bacterium]